MTIGMLIAQVQCLRRLRITPERARDIILMYFLNNIATIRGQQHDLQEDHPNNPSDVRDGIAVRDIIFLNHNLDEMHFVQLLYC